MNKQARKQQQPQRSTAASAPRHHGTLTYHKPLIALTANEARLYIQDLKARLAQKMQRERAYLDRRAARGTHTPTDEAYEAPNTSFYCYCWGCYTARITERLAASQRGGGRR